MPDDPFEKFSPQEPDQTRWRPPATAKWVLAITATVFVALAAVAGFVFYGLATAPKPEGRAVEAEIQSAPTRTNGPDDPIAGECVRVEGNVLTRVGGCAKGTHDHVIASVKRDGEDCGPPGVQDPYVRYIYSGSIGLCLVPVYVDGQCYASAQVSGFGDIQKLGCDRLGAVRVRVLTDTADAAACTPAEREHLVYPEIRTTYCFTRVN